MGIQIYDQVSILISWLKAKLHRAVLLGFCLKGIKNNSEHHKSWRALLSSKCTLNLWSNFNSEKLVNSETPSCGFSKIGVRGGENSSNVVKVGVHGYLSNGNPNLWSNFNYEKVIRSENLSCILTRVGLEGVQIAQTIAKVGMHVFISNGHPNRWSNFNSKNLVKSETPSFDFS